MGTNKVKIKSKGLKVDKVPHLDKISSEVFKLFPLYNWYYIKNYEIEGLLPYIYSYEGLYNAEIATLFYNLDYNMLKYRKKTEWIEWFNQVFYYLVTSFDIHGVKVPLNFYEEKHIHPGGKRVCISEYLGLKTVPVLIQTKKKLDTYDINLQSIFDLQKVYPNNNFTAFVGNNFPKGHYPIEIHYLESNHRDENNIDGWMEEGKNNLPSNGIQNIPYFLLEHGLNIVGNWDKNELGAVRIGEFTLIFSHEPVNPYFVKLNDMTYKNCDFWKLIYYFDPRYKLKTSLNNEIALYNTTITAKKKMKSKNMLQTLLKSHNRIIVTK